METTYDPIVRTDGMPRFRLSQQRPAPEPGKAIVLFREGEPLITIWPDKRLTAGEARWGRFKTIHIVDVTDHRLQFKWELPSSGDAFKFHADVIVDCTVADPAVVVKRNVRNVGEVVGSLIQQRMRKVTRGYDVKDSAAAEEALSGAVADLASEHPNGLEIKSVYVELSLDEEAAHWKKELERIDRERKRIAQEKDLKIDQAQADADVKHKEETGNIAIKELQVQFFRKVIEDRVGLVALHAAQRPQDIPAIITMIREHDLGKLDRYINALRLLIENDALEGHHLEGYALEYVNALKVALESERTSIGSSEPADALPDAVEEPDVDGEPGPAPDDPDPDEG